MRLLRIILLLAGLLALPPGVTQAQAEPVVVQISPEETTAVAGQVFEVAVAVVDVNNLYGFAVGITFDPGVLQVQDSDPNLPGVQVGFGTFLEPGLVIINRVDNVNGTIEFGMTQLNPSLPQSGSGNLLVISLRGAAANTSSDLNMVFVQLAQPQGVEIPSTGRSGRVDLVAQPPPGPTSTPLPTQPPGTTLPSPTPLATLAPTATATPTTPAPTQPPATATATQAAAPTPTATGAAAATTTAPTPTTPGATPTTGATAGTAATATAVTGTTGSNESAAAVTTPDSAQPTTAAEPAATAAAVAGESDPAGAEVAAAGPASAPATVGFATPPSIVGENIAPPAGQVGAAPQSGVGWSWPAAIAGVVILAALAAWVGRRRG